MIIIFYLKLDISARARAHACAQMCAAHKCAPCWNTGQAISEYNYKQDLYFISLCAFWAYMYTGTILRVKSEKFCSDAAKVSVLLDSGVHVPNLPIVFRISSSSSSCVRLTYFCSGFAIAVWLPNLGTRVACNCSIIQLYYSSTKF